jgi:hypothetical protein
MYVECFRVPGSGACIMMFGNLAEAVIKHLKLLQCDQPCKYGFLKPVLAITAPMPARKARGGGHVRVSSQSNDEVIIEDAGVLDFNEMSSDDAEAPSVSDDEISADDEEEDEQEAELKQALLEYQTTAARLRDEEAGIADEDGEQQE